MIGERVDEDAKVLQSLGVKCGQKLGKLRVGSGGAGHDRDERRRALEPKHDVGCEQAQLLALVGRGDDRARARLLGNGLGIIAADSTADELAEQRPLVAEARIDGLSGDTRRFCDRGDGRAVVAALFEQLRSSVEHPVPRLLGLLEAAL